MSTRIIDQGLAPEVYANSLRPLRGLGRIGMHGVVSLETVKHSEALHDFVTLTAEGLVFDKSEAITTSYIDITRIFSVVDGRAVDEHGMSLVDIAELGATYSAELARMDPRADIQYYRDRDNVVVAKAVDNLKDGEALMIKSCAPDDGIRRDGLDYWTTENYTYKQGLAVEMIFRRIGDTVESRFITIPDYTLDKARVDLAEQGLELPADITESQVGRHYVRYGVDIASQALLQRSIDKSLHANEGLLDMTTLVGKHETVITEYFMKYIMPLAMYLGKAEANSTNQAVFDDVNVGTFAMALLSNRDLDLSMEQQFCLTKASSLRDTLVD
jgi:hypothetical protein